MRNNPESNKVREEREGEGAPGDPVACGRANYFPAVCGVDNARVDIHPAAHKGQHTEAVRHLKKTLQPMESSILHGKNVRGKKWQFGYGLIITPHSPPTPHPALLGGCQVTDQG